MQETKRAKEKRKENPTDTDVQLPPLIILKDCGAQTEQSYPTREKESGLLINWLVLYAVFALILYGLVCMSVAHSDFLQTILVYRHYPSPLASPEELQNLIGFGLLSARNIQHLKPDGGLLRGWHILPMAGDKDNLSRFANMSLSSTSTVNTFFDGEIARGGKAIVIYLHGNTADRSLGYRIEMMKQISLTMDAHVVAFDYAGFGDSEGWPSEESTYADALSIYTWVKEAIGRGSHILRDNPTCQDYPVFGCSDSPKPPRIFLYGHSLGSSIAVNLAVELNGIRGSEQHPLRGIVLDAPFTSFPDAIRSHPNSALFRVFPFVQTYM